MARLTSLRPALGMVAGVAALAMLLLAGDAQAQRRYTSDPLDGGLRRSGATVKSWVKRPDDDPQKVQQFNDYFKKYYFPSMTLATPEGLGQIGKLRYDLFRSYIDAADPRVRGRLVNDTFAFAKRVVANQGPNEQRANYHRSVRFNAVLVLGQLDESEGRPLVTANQFLNQISSLASDKRLPAYMQAGALVGLARHAAALDKLPAQQQEQTVATLTKAAGPDAAVDTVGPLTRDWLRRRAALGLAAACQKTPDAAATMLLLKLVDDKSLTLDSRAEIGAALEGLSLPPNGAAAKSVLALATEIAAEESAEASEFEDMQVGRRRMSRQSQGMIDSNRYRVSYEEGELEYIRPAVAARLNNLKKALNATSATAGQLADGVTRSIEAIDEVIDLAVSDQSIDLDITAAIQQMALAIGEATPGGAAEEAEAADGDEGLF